MCAQWSRRVAREGRSWRYSPTIRERDLHYPQGHLAHRSPMKLEFEPLKEGLGGKGFMALIILKAKVPGTAAPPSRSRPDPKKRHLAHRRPMKHEIEPLKVPKSKPCSLTLRFCFARAPACALKGTTVLWHTMLHEAGQLPKCPSAPLFQPNSAGTLSC